MLTPSLLLLLLRENAAVAERALIVLPRRYELNNGKRLLTDSTYSAFSRRLNATLLSGPVAKGVVEIQNRTYLLADIAQLVGPAQLGPAQDAEGEERGALAYEETRCRASGCLPGGSTRGPARAPRERPIRAYQLATSRRLKRASRRGTSPSSQRSTLVRRWIAR